MSAVDLYPSICSMLGIDYPDDLDGTDKSQALLGQPLSDNPPVMWEYGSAPQGSIVPGKTDHVSPTLAIRLNDWKLLINPDSSNAMLFNLKHDPGESNNLIEENEALAQELARMVIEWRKEMPVSIR